MDRAALANACRLYIGFKQDNAVRKAHFSRAAQFRCAHLPPVFSLQPGLPRAELMSGSRPPVHKIKKAFDYASSASHLSPLSPASHLSFQNKNPLPRHARCAKHLFWIGRLSLTRAARVANKRSAVEPPIQKRRLSLRVPPVANKRSAVEPPIQKRGCIAPYSRAAQLTAFICRRARQYCGDSSDFCAERFEGVD